MNTRKRLSKLFLLPVTLLLLASAGAAEARAQATVITSSTKVPIEFFNADSCTGDQVAINGTSHLLFHANGSPGGHSNEKLEINFALRGVSASGVEYVVNETVTATTEGSAGGAFVFNTVGHLNVVSQGGAENLLIRTEIHTTFNANGELTSSKFVFTVECQG
jgi:hypothetical protein